MLKDKKDNYFHYYMFKDTRVRHNNVTSYTVGKCLPAVEIKKFIWL